MSSNNRGSALFSRFKKIRQLIAGFFGTLAQHCADPQRSPQLYSTVQTFVKHTSGSFIVDELGRRATVDEAEDSRRNINARPRRVWWYSWGSLHMLNSEPGEAVE